MKNIFAQEPHYDETLKKNVFDLSHRENLTMDYGKIYPLGQPIEVLPGDSVDLSLSAALHAMPLVFPVQTPMQFKLFVFYVPNRLLFDGWKDYITGVYDNTSKKPVHPYHSFISEAQYNKMIGVGSLLDYLGVPPVAYGDFACYSHSQFEQHPGDINASDLNIDGESTPGEETGTNVYSFVGGSASRRYAHTECYLFNKNVYSTIENTLTHTTGSYLNTALDLLPQSSRILSRLVHRLPVNYLDPSDVKTSTMSLSKVLSDPLSTSSPSIVFDTSINDDLSSYDDKTLSELGCQLCLFEQSNNTSSDYVLTRFSDNTIDKFRVSSSDTTSYRIDIVDTSFVGYFNAAIASGRKVKIGLLTWYDSGNIFVYLAPYLNVDTIRGLPYSFSYSTDRSVSSRISYLNSPYAGSQPRLPLNALPARCYEMCCRSYFLNDKVMPMLDSNNEPIYNDFLRNHSGGADTNTYDFFYANYELDQFTDAVPSPQFGEAPLVGLTITSGHSATLHFSAENITGTGAQSSGGTLDADVTFTDDDNMQLTGITRYDAGLPDANLRRLMHQVNYGISINDIRNVNSLQRYKERMQRRSYRYKDQIMNHFGQHVSNVEAEMPQYIGGYNFDIVVNKINNTAAPQSSDAAPLGDYAAQASIFGKMQRNIKHHCDEHGFIMVLGYVVPRPVYSQALPKVFTKIVDKFDYYTPEFSKIGYVPVSNYELAPIQFDLYDQVNNTHTLNGTFGYQKAWYDYMSMYDGCHGDFRTSLADYLAMRLFNEKPQLNSRFITVHGDDISNIFSVNNGDHFLGFVDYNLHIARPIPRFAVPSLE